MTEFFVYRAPDHRWWVSAKSDRELWEPVADFTTWSSAFHYAYVRAVDERSRYRFHPVSHMKTAS
jgi:hypothetical protein